ncbi:hypothetical protein GCM10010399_70520 [Dactylosporangium fulvum]|uniref:Carboxypeptidase regulatory-like domain-containing protein n=1 Tax=Dactylosporangium fulvum TaxID=53359 RepID=A0ABY5W2G8_9ACTN|nr:hypothetical protein [Dactylosporangium fulvum]UWP83464.1 hypothetical protein Dfulv_04035 [Dactylosporangium fulvum]
MNDDEQLLRELGAAVRDAARVPDSFLAAGRAAFAWRNVDAELASLTLDAEPAATRAEPAPLRAFTFAAREIAIEVEVAEDALLGQIVPPRPGRIELRTGDGTTRATEVDEVGWFTFRPLPTGMFRLYFQTPDGSQVLTEWVSL